MQGYEKSPFSTNISLWFISEMIQDRTVVVTMECERETVLKLSSGTVFNDLEQPLIQIARSRHYLTLNISETVRHRDIGQVTMATEQPTLYNVELPTGYLACLVRSRIAWWTQGRMTDGSQQLNGTSSFRYSPFRFLSRCTPHIYNRHTLT